MGSGPRRRGAHKTPAARQLRNGKPLRTDPPLKAEPREGESQEEKTTGKGLGMKTRSAELAWTGNLVITGAAVMAIGVAMTVWETRAEHTLVLDAAQEAPSIETLSIVEATERGSDRGKIMVSADGAFLSGKLLETMIAGGDEEYTRFVDAVRPMGGESIPVRIERMTGYVDELYARHGRNLTTPSLSAGSMVVLFGVAIIISAVAGEKICKRYITDDKHAADEPRGTIDELGWLSHRAGVRACARHAPRPPTRGST